jgi:hypothetical protein
MRRLETSPRITPHYDAWSVELRPSTTVGIVGYTIPFVLKCVQQLCSNPGKSPEMLGKATTYKYGYLQEFCKLQEAPANHRAAFARRRSGVRISSAPLQKDALLQEKLKPILSTLILT